jgi:hypothetical protein
VDAALYEIVDFLDVDVLPSDVLDVGSFGLNNLFESVPNVVSLLRTATSTILSRIGDTTVTDAALSFESSLKLVR